MVTPDSAKTAAVYAGAVLLTKLTVHFEPGEHKYSRFDEAWRFVYPFLWFAVLPVALVLSLFRKEND